MTRIAIVEDNPTIRESLAELVNSISGCQCIASFETGEDAEAKIPELSPDLVMMDINLPGMDGIECTARIKNLQPEARVLILTIYEDGEKIFDALKAGASGYILKRSSPSDIVRAIEEMLDGGAPMTPVIALKVVESFREVPTRAHQIDHLSNRENEVLQLLSKGLFNKEIAQELQISIETVRWHLRQIYEKLHVNCRTEAALKFLHAKQRP
ncbi:DNA-binding NarL/FixJ family response regulator [Haloferula luteola]|uniref:DNA-binding NarL/FixJ family response regulator n=1 Tax=Haloferula luteola TaxID=595692 RepID=A0A840VLS1_9BACT|nr:response regulator transcription factor [Haloferula luteola]MBB5353571.1 DNA-binding NarL/FixJ family response regulator [Haloferula luteola]